MALPVCPLLMHASDAAFCTVFGSDLYVYDPATMAWTDLSNSPPVARVLHGLASAGGKLYVHGGYIHSGDVY
jgi:N-acetylneuraminic acid mutarotase